MLPPQQCEPTEDNPNADCQPSAGCLPPRPQRVRGSAGLHEIQSMERLGVISARGDNANIRIPGDRTIHLILKTAVDTPPDGLLLQPQVLEATAVVTHLMKCAAVESLGLPAALTIKRRF
jgi:hypothetical protein